MRCALTNLGTNAWNIIASLYWTLVGFGQEKEMLEYLDIGYEWICTCQEDAGKILDALGGNNNSKSAGMLATCSESGAVKKGDAKTKQKERRQAQLDARKQKEDDEKRA